MAALSLVSRLEVDLGSRLRFKKVAAAGFSEPKDIGILNGDNCNYNECWCTKTIQILENSLLQ